MVIKCVARKGVRIPLGSIRQALERLFDEGELTEGKCELRSYVPTDVSVDVDEKPILFSAVISGYPDIYSVRLVPSATFPEFREKVEKIILRQKETTEGYGFSDSEKGVSVRLFVEAMADRDGDDYSGAWQKDALLVKHLLLSLFVWWPRLDSSEDGPTLVSPNQLRYFLQEKTGFRAVAPFVTWLCKEEYVQAIRGSENETICYRLEVAALTAAICSEGR